MVLMVPMEYPQGQTAHWHQGKWKQWAAMMIGCIGCLIKLNIYTQNLRTGGSYLRCKIVVDCD